MKWFLAALFLLLVGLVLEWGLLVFATYVLLGVLLVSRALTSRWIASVELTRGLVPERAEIGEVISIGVQIRNQGMFKIPWLMVEDAVPLNALSEIPPRFELNGSRVLLSDLQSGEAKELNYQVSFLRRGYYGFGPTWVETGDLFGLQRKYHVKGSTSYVLVPPAIAPMESMDFRSRKAIGEVRITHRLFEDPTRVSGIRDYEMGDPLNRIHWRATARTGKLHSKTYEPSCVAEIMMVLDFYEPAYPERGRMFRSETAITAVASIAHAMAQLGQPVGLITNGRDAADRIREESQGVTMASRNEARASAHRQVASDRLRPIILPPQRGEEAYQRQLDVLARLEFTDGMRIEELLEETRPMLPRNATILVVLPQITERVALLLSDLHVRGYALSVVWVAFDEEDLPDWAEHPDWSKWLIAAGIDVRKVRNESEISTLCSGNLSGIGLRG